MPATGWGGGWLQPHGQAHLFHLLRHSWNIRNTYPKGAASNEHNLHNCFRLHFLYKWCFALLCLVFCGLFWIPFRITFIVWGEQLALGALENPSRLSHSKSCPLLLPLGRNLYSSPLLWMSGEAAFWSGNATELGEEAFFKEVGS